MNLLRQRQISGAFATIGAYFGINGIFKTTDEGRGSAFFSLQGEIAI